jgi:uncharacterized protein (TIGR02217 family)
MFYEVEFPRGVRFGLAGGSSFSTTINESYSGFEQRNKNWSQSRAAWTVTFQTRAMADWETIHNFFLVVSGSADPFRLHWPLDYKATGAACLPATGDGANKNFQLQKQYGPLNGRTYTRTIKKPVTASVKDWQGTSLTNTVVVYLNGSVQNPSGYTVDYTTGIITFISAPGNGVAVTSDFQFHYPVRFDTDDMGGGAKSGGSAATIEESGLALGNPLVTWGNIPLVEVRL